MLTKISWALPLFLLLLATLWWFNPFDALPSPSNSSQIVTSPAQITNADESQREQQKLAPLTRLGKGGSIDIALDPTHQHIAIATATGVYLYDQATFTQRNFVETDAPVQAVTFAPSGTTVIFTTMGSNRQLYQWHPSDDQLTSYPLDKSLTHGLAFSPDGAYLVGMSFDALFIWQMATMELLVAHEQLGVLDKNFAFSPDGQLLVSPYGNKLELWHIAEGKLLQTVELEEGAFFNGRWSRSLRMVRESLLPTYVIPSSTSGASQIPMNLSNKRLSV